MNTGISGEGLPYWKWWRPPYGCEARQATKTRKLLCNIYGTRGERMDALEGRGGKSGRGTLREKRPGFVEKMWTYVCPCPCPCACHLSPSCVCCVCSRSDGRAESWLREASRNQFIHRDFVGQSSPLSASSRPSPCKALQDDPPPAPAPPHRPFRHGRRGPTEVGRQASGADGPLH